MAEFRMTTVIRHQFMSKAPNSTIRHDTLFIKTRQDTLGGFRNEIDSGLTVDTEVSHLPFDLFAVVFFLFKIEHVVVEELLETFVGKVDAKLFKTVHQENLKTGNI